MGDGVIIDAAKVEAAVQSIWTISSSWLTHSHDFAITGVGPGVADKTAAAVTTWQKELQTAHDGMGDVALKIEGDLAAFAELDDTMGATTTSPDPGPRPR